MFNNHTEKILDGLQEPTWQTTTSPIVEPKTEWEEEFIEKGALLVRYLLGEWC